MAYSSLHPFRHIASRAKRCRCSVVHVVQAGRTWSAVACCSGMLGVSMDHYMKMVGKHQLQSCRQTNESSATSFQFMNGGKVYVNIVNVFLHDFHW